jgi:hypothetical protein
MGFEREHDQWLSNHVKRRKGERLDALKRGHGYGNRLFVEQVVAACRTLSRTTPGI